MHIFSIRHLSVFLLGATCPLTALFDAYVTNLNGPDVAQILLDPTTGAPTLGATSNIVGNGAKSIAIDPKQQNLYVGTGTGVIEQFRINPITGAPILASTVTIPFGDIVSIAVAPNGKYAYLIDDNNQKLVQLVLDPVSGAPSIGAIVSTGQILPESLAIDPTSSNIYVTHADGASTVTQMSIDLLTGIPSFTSSTSMGGRIGIVVAPNGQNVYATDNATNEFIQMSINGSGHATVVTSISATDPLFFAIAPSGNNAYIALQTPDSVFQVSINPSGTPTAGSTVSSGGSNPSNVAIAPDEKNAYVTNPSSGTLSQISLSPSGVPTYTGNTIFTGGNLPLGIVIASFTPFNPSINGKQIKNEFLTQTDLINVITWNALPSTLFYNIYRDAALTDLATTIFPNGPSLQFQDHNRKKGVTYSYYIVAYDVSHFPMELGSVTVHPKKN